MSCRTLKAPFEHCGCGPSLACENECEASGVWLRYVRERMAQESLSGRVRFEFGEDVLHSRTDVKYFEAGLHDVLACRRENASRARSLLPITDLSVPDMAAVDQLDGYGFELLVAELVEKSGGELIQAQGGAGDGGVDVLATLPQLGKTAVQCKHTTVGKSIPSSWVRELNGCARPDHDADTVILVTNGGFTQPARHAAKRYNIQCIDRMRLGAWAFGWCPLEYVLDRSPLLAFSATPVRLSAAVRKRTVRTAQDEVLFAPGDADRSNLDLF